MCLQEVWTPSWPAWLQQATTGLTHRYRSVDAEGVINNKRLQSSLLYDETIWKVLDTKAFFWAPHRERGGNERVLQWVRLKKKSDRDQCYLDVYNVNGPHGFSTTETIQKCGTELSNYAGLPSWLVFAGDWNHEQSLNNRLSYRLECHERNWLAF